MCVCGRAVEALGRPHGPSHHAQQQGGGQKGRERGVEVTECVQQVADKRDHQRALGAQEANHQRRKATEHCKGTLF